jgi:hypothetical protein
MRLARWVLGAWLLTALVGCDAAYYGAMEKVGVHKRDILRDRVEAAMDAQEEAKQEFRSALEQFESVVGVQSGELKAAYARLQGAYDDAEARANGVSDRIAAVEDVSGDLFAEWEKEIGLISNPKLKAGSRRQLQASRTAYRGFIAAMRRAESRMQPVLTAFRDQVLYLKHNLNAQAIASLKGELVAIEGDVGRLILDMEESIRQSQAFLDQLPASAG